MKTLKIYLFLALTVFASIANGRVFNATEEIRLAPASGSNTIIEGDQVIIDGGQLYTSGTSTGALPCNRMTTAERDAIVSPDDGECVYNTTTGALNVYTSPSWSGVGGGGLDKWITGNSYVVDDVIWDPTSEQIYRANADHTAGATFAGDVANWDKLAYENELADTQITYGNGAGVIEQDANFTYTSASQTMGLGTFLFDGVNQLISGANNVDIAISSSGTGALLFDDIAIQNNVISADTTDNDVILQGNGNGEVVINDGLVFVSASAQTPDPNDLVVFADAGLLKQKDENGVVRALDSEKDRTTLINPSFEDSHAGDADLGFTVSGSATATVETTTIIPSEGKQALSLAVTASAFEFSQTFDCSGYKSGQTLGHTVYVSSTEDIEVCGFDGTTDLNCVTPTSDDQYQLALAEVSGGGTCGIKIKSDAVITDTILIDGIKFTDQPYRFVDVGVISDFTNVESLAVSGSTTDPVFGTLDVSETSIRQVGSEGEVRINFRTSTSGASAGSGEYLISLPDGKRFASDVQFFTDATNPVTGLNVNAFGTLVFARAGDRAVAQAVPYNATQYRLLISSVVDNGGNSQSSGFWFSSANYSASSGTHKIHGTFSVPIEGFSASSKHVVTDLKTGSHVYEIEQAQTSLTNTGGEIEYNLGTATINEDILGDTLFTVVDDSGNTRTQFVASKPIIMTVTVYGAIASGTLGIFKNGSILLPGDKIGANDEDNSSVSIHLDTGDYITVGSNGGAVTGNATLFTTKIVAMPRELSIAGAFPFDRMQSKNFGTNPIVFNNLIVGKVYQLSGSAYFAQAALQPAAISASVSITGAMSGTYGCYYNDNHAGQEQHACTVGLGNTFVATSDTLTITASSSSMTLNTTNPVTLIEKNTTKEVSGF